MDYLFNYISELSPANKADAWYMQVIKYLIKTNARTLPTSTLIEQIPISRHDYYDFLTTLENMEHRQLIQRLGKGVKNDPYLITIHPKWTKMLCKKGCKRW
jgi:hypothetical protein